MCGGQTQTTQSVQIPPDVLARYNSVNQTAQTAAQQPFQVYSTDPNAFVAPLDSTQQSGIANTNAAVGQAQPYFDAATGQLINAQSSTQPYFDAATGQYLNAEGAASGLYGGALGDFNNAQAQGSTYVGYGQGDLSAGQAQGAGLAGASLQALNQANTASVPLEQHAAQNIGQGLSAAQPYNSAAGSAIGQGLAAAQPLNSAANSNISSAQAGAQPYQQLATGLGLAGAQAVDPSQLSGQSINQYLSPYLSTVLSSTQGLLNQQNQQQMSGQLGNAIQSGAFGGDRSGIAAANLAQQQQLANANIYSGILNQGYNTALGTAQQQQGLSLSADQANRAALQAASGQLQSIGQQGFGQGITTAQQQAALGQQQYGQYTGTGQAIQGLGNQVYGQSTGTGQAQAALGNQLYTQGANTASQEAALGQQLFGQGLASSQQEGALGQQTYNMGSQTGQNLQGLGQTVFNTGSQTGQNLQNLGQANYATGANTSQALAGLGTGAQGAALQGAQAQLAAGQTQQQTQQAGLTALYNQFLQQQSYPFQVSQFLANIAEGTGALSGSTTTTTQPGGFFSDKRLKEDIEKVGKTFDGQDIYSFRYKGDPRKQIGLVAQDVEKTHPDAVGERSGFKTVDYGKATEKAASRGHFYRGGLAAANDSHANNNYAEGGVAGFDPQMMQQILANQQGTYGPYLAAASGAGPYGGAGRVPAGNLPVSQLKTAGPAPAVKSPFENAKTIADLGTSLDKDANDASKGFDWLKGKLSQPDEPPYARGGLVGFADGGMPYGDDTGGLDIPDEKPQLNQLPTPGKPPAQGPSGLSDAKDATEAALAVAKLIAMMHTGGKVERKGYAEGGLPDDSDDPDAVDFSTPSPGGILPPDMTYKPTNNTSLPQIKVGQVTPKQIGRTALSAILPAVDTIPKLVQGLSGLIHPQTGASASWDSPAPAQPKHAAPKPRPVVRAAPAAGLGAAEPADQPDSTPSVAPMPAPETVDSAGPVAAPPPADVQGLTDTPAELATDASKIKPDSPSILDRIQNSPIGGYASGLKHGDLPTWISLLSALGAAGTAPTVHPGVALAAGLTGGAQGYMGAKKVQAQVAQEQALTGTQQATTGLTQAQTYNQMQLKAPAGYVAVPGAGPNGQHITGYDGKPWHYEMQVNATNFGASPSSSSAPAEAPALPGAKPVPSVLTPSTDTDAFMASQYHVDPSQPAVANHERAIALNPELGPLDDAARASLQTRVGNLQEAANTNRQLVQLSQAINDLSKSSLTGQGHGSDYRTKLGNLLVTTANMVGVPIDPSTLKDIGDQQIIAKIKELSGAQMAHQYGEKAASIAHAITGVLPGGDLRPEAANEILGSMLVQNQQPRDLSQYGNNYVQRYGVAVNLEPAFAKDTDALYNNEQKKLPLFMSSPGYSGALADLHSADGKVRQRAEAIIDAHYGPGFHRYFSGSQ